MCKIFSDCERSCPDPLMIAKLMFFHLFEDRYSLTFKGYQTDAPMIPFQADDIMELLYGHLSLFIKKEVLDRVRNLRSSEMIKIDIVKKDDLVNVKNVEIGFATRKVLKSYLQDKKRTEQDVYI